MNDTGLVWFRRDLRATDHPALSRALRECRTIGCAFILDAPLLATLPRVDRRVEFIRESLVDLDRALRGPRSRAPRLIVRHADAREEIPRIAAALGAGTVYAHHDDDPYALQRDAAVRAALERAGRRLVTLKDHVVFERSEILTQAGKPFSV
ncbi:MAG TPA: deoxyribodipyrimidine photo-lyase, partial [Burkholderiaceae bacterium]|nr:deoxyribodipyrimidine photo-lyase [Burkholderiaceae bacterium]